MTDAVRKEAETAMWVKRETSYSLGLSDASDKEMNRTDKLFAYILVDSVLHLDNS